MSLKIDVVKLTQYESKQDRLQLRVSGGKAGQLISPFIHDSKPEWNKPYFEIEASRDDVLQFELFAVRKSKLLSMGSTSLCCPKLIKSKKEQLSRDLPYEYQLDLQMNEKCVGNLVLLIKYEPGLLYEGNFPSQVNLSLISSSDTINIYRGKCATTNIFSFLDEPIAGQVCKFTESIYRDHQ